MPGEALQCPRIPAWRHSPVRSSPPPGAAAALRLPCPNLPAPDADLAGRARCPAALDRALSGAVVLGLRRAALRRMGGAGGGRKSVESECGAVTVGRTYL